MKIKHCSIALLSIACSFADTRGQLVSEEVAPILESATFYSNFDQGGVAPGIGDAGKLVENTAEIVPLNDSSYALKSENHTRAKYRAEGIIDFSVPGSLSFWVSPRGWQWENERPYNHFFTAEGPQGRVVITRMGLVKYEGEPASRLDSILLHIDGFDGIEPRTNVNLGPSDPEVWADETWHFFVLNWDGASWSISMDGKDAKFISIPRILGAGEISTFSIGGTEEPTFIKHFTIYNKLLSEDEIQKLYNHQRPAN